MACGQQKVKGGHGSNIASSSASCSASSNASSKAQQVLKKNCEIGVGFSFAVLSVFRLRRAEAASALWIPHWHWEPCESQGARAAKRCARAELPSDPQGTRLNSTHQYVTRSAFCLKEEGSLPRAC